MEPELVSYEWNPKTEVAKLTYERLGQPYTVTRKAPLKVDPFDYWGNLYFYLLTQVRK